MYADSFAITGTEDAAVNDVGRAAGAQVCGFYAGDAETVSLTRVDIGGDLYQMTRYKFQQDGREAFSATRVFEASDKRADEGL